MRDLFSLFDADLDEPDPIFGLDACTLDEAHQLI
jgi:hypothetical protein